MKTNEIRQGNHMEEDDDDSHLEIEKLLQTLTIRLLKCELEDFELVRTIELFLLSYYFLWSLAFSCPYSQEFYWFFQLFFCVHSFRRSFFKAGSIEYLNSKKMRKNGLLQRIVWFLKMWSYFPLENGIFLHFLGRPPNK